MNFGFLFVSFLILVLVNLLLDLLKIVVCFGLCSVIESLNLLLLKFGKFLFWVSLLILFKIFLLMFNFKKLLINCKVFFCVVLLL